MLNFERRVWTYRSGAWTQAARSVVLEQAVSLTVNGRELMTFMCTPRLLDALAVGFLYNEGWIDSRDEVAEVRVCADASNVDVLLRRAVEPPQRWRRTSGCSGGVTAAEMALPPLPADDRSLTPDQIAALVRVLFREQDLYHQTGGIHISVLSDGMQAILSAEDIGRHNSLDKLAGLLLEEPPSRRAAARVLLTSGRISSEMLQKARRMRIPVVISKTSPSSLSVQQAEESGITLIGYARPHRFTLYTHPERVAPLEKRWAQIA